MELHHREAIKNNLGFLCRDVDYSRLRPEMLKHRLFPERQLLMLEENNPANLKLELFLQVQVLGADAFLEILALILLTLLPKIILDQCKDSSYPFYLAQRTKNHPPTPLLDQQHLFYVIIVKQKSVMGD